MKERAQELKAAARRSARAHRAEGENDVLAKIADMPGPDRAMARRLHAIIRTNAARTGTFMCGRTRFAAD